ncbi:hypothetical protein [Nocardia testacea]|uniref:Resolvase/invertase-type recombinase catalytic domain-containing protein n=1 Tax=Nocardia testacea TaxID=248551 RepID=A0ABW7W145_9NOCA
MTSAERAPALVYMRTDLSGHAQKLDACRLRRLAIRFGYELREVLLVDGTRPRRLLLLEDRIRVHAAEAVFVPTVDHLDGQLGRIVAQADVIEQSGETYARWSPIALMLGDVLLTQAVGWVHASRSARGMF